MAKKKINTNVIAYDVYGNKHSKHIRAESTAEFVKKKEEFEKSLQNLPFVAEVLDEWQKHHFENINLNTQSCYVKPISQVREYFENVRIDELKPLDVDRFLRYIFDKYRYKKQTLKLRLIVLNQMCDFAILKGYINNNPCLSVKVPKQAVSGKRDLPIPEDIENIKKRATESLCGLFMAFILYTGCRKCEALAVRYEDINRIDNTIRINKTVIFDGNIPTIQNHTKSAAGMRSVPFLAPLRQLLPPNRKGLIFTHTGELLTRSEIHIMLKQYKSQTGITATPHQLRHFYATFLLDADVKAKDAGALLGNNPDVTEKIYQHITEERQKATFQKLQDFIG